MAKIKLNKKLIEAVVNIAKEHDDAVFTGSLALFLQGITDQHPKDIDVMMSDVGGFFIKEDFEYHGNDMPASDPLTEAKNYMKRMDMYRDSVHNAICELDSEDHAGMIRYTMTCTFTMPYNNDEEGQFFEQASKTLSVTRDGVRIDLIPSECEEVLETNIMGQRIKIRRADAILDAKRKLYEATKNYKHLKGMAEMLERCSSKYPKTEYSKSNKELAKLLEDNAYMQQNLAKIQNKSKAAKKVTVKSDTSDKKQGLADTKSVKTDFKVNDFTPSDPSKFNKMVMSFKQFSKAYDENQPVTGKSSLHHDGVGKNHMWGYGNAYDERNDDFTSNHQVGEPEEGPSFAHGGEGDGGE